MNQSKVEQAIDKLADMTDEERREVFAAFCTDCGSDDPDCQCWNGE